MDKSRFNKKLMYRIVTFLLLSLIGISYGPTSISLPFLVITFILFSALTYKNYKEMKNPSFYEDERSLNLAYKADSISLRITSLCMVVIFLVGNTLLNNIALKDLTGFLLFVMLVSKIISYMVLQRKY
ncbi:MAG: DUF2178 domain-containing protein [Anaeromicrobium sp.]|jgi:uncharacterized membrane protein|uniref:DUF2178 domain-containing protein n=1 Tax=Anaeromicrobium sp. TaxID=1929132 RepID=UPI0025E1E1D0|nr:DUF2178 domain-containing protein [Anaeromicrobium sp.]MCT4593456.1 DUF2178 domain-containing protein [Anaeromicrobium sp.]